MLIVVEHHERDDRHRGRDRGAEDDPVRVRGRDGRLVGARVMAEAAVRGDEVGMGFERQDRDERDERHHLQDDEGEDDAGHDLHLEQ
jgi:hypothetical protein